MDSLPRVIYWDYFANDYCLQKDEFAPPERYVETYAGPEHTFIERWDVTGNRNGGRLNIAFDENLYKGDRRELDRVRRYQFETNKCQPRYLISFSIPKPLFEKYALQLMGVKDETD